MRSSVYVLYFTRLRVVQRTFEDCRTVRSILRGFRVPIDEHDLSMDGKYLGEMQDKWGLAARDFLETDVEIRDDGKLHVTVRKSNASRRSGLGLTPGSFSKPTPRPSNLTGAEIYSLSSSGNPILVDLISTIPIFTR
ncbi:Auxin efflux carrier component 7 [Linum perenne]